MREPQRPKWSDQLDEISRDVQARQEHAIAAMRAQGREPASCDGQYFISGGSFSITLRWPSDESDAAEIRILAQNSRASDEPVFLLGAPWPEPGMEVGGSDLLFFLTRNWHVIGSGYTLENTDSKTPALAEEVLDLDLFLKPSPTPTFKIIVKDGEIVLATKDAAIEFGLESIIVVECLLALGDLIAMRLKRLGVKLDRVANWRQARTLTDVLPMRIEVDPETPDAAEWHERPHQDAFFWARRLGQDDVEYRCAALWLQARQWMFAENGENEPTADEWRVETIPKNLPSERDVTNLIDFVLQGDVAHRSGVDSYETFARDAISQRNMMARAHIFYTLRRKNVGRN